MSLQLRFVLTFVFSVQLLVVTNALSKNCTESNRNDIIMVVDSSQSIEPHDFVKQRSFVVKLLNSIDIGHDTNRVAMVVYDHNVYVHFPFLDNRIAINVNVHMIPHLGGYTATGDALKVARQIVLPMRRPNVPTTVFLITDGRKNYGSDVIEQARLLKEMPKNKGKGGKNYKKAKHAGPVKRELVTKESDEGLEYGLAEKMLGNGRVLVKCFDEVVRVGHIRGKMKRKVWIGMGDLVLCSLREFQNKKCDIILKYLPDEIKQLRAQGCIKDFSNDNEGPTEGIEFVDDVGELSESSSDSDSDSDSNSDDGGDYMQKKIEEKKKEINIDDI